MRSLICMIFFLGLAFPAGVFGQELSPTESGEAAAGEEEFTEFYDPFSEEEIRIADPIEPFNRAMFWVNDKLYFYLLKPVARTYRVVPEPARLSVNNFFDNLGFPVRFVNSALQLKFGAAGNELSRFLINSTVGFLGFFDPATEIGWKEYDEDFGQTLGRYGVGQGFYLVLPLFGPSSLRDGVGRTADYFLDPVPYAVEDYELLGVKAYDRVNTLSLDDETYEKIKEQAIDPYLFIRNAYAQRREALVDK